ncbi:hypothetical protein GOD83_32220 [Sinorhizobium medicae]|nr:hypothetical protein [Sinorhizobium medicae]MDX0581114.1 hypothetical protein [Sinorhizobium medicae]MDX0784749.1 hypothetical protein [Sinorhizobium medicae]
MIRTSVNTAGLTNPSTKSGAVWLRTMLTGAAVAMAMTSPAAAGTSPAGAGQGGYKEECSLRVISKKNSILSTKECERWNINSNGKQTKK